MESRAARDRKLKAETHSGVGEQLSSSQRKMFSLYLAVASAGLAASQNHYLHLSLPKTTSLIKVAPNGIIRQDDLRSNPNSLEPSDALRFASEWHRTQPRETRILIPSWSLKRTHVETGALAVPPLPLAPDVPTTADQELHLSHLNPVSFSVTVHQPFQCWCWSHWRAAEPWAHVTPH